MLKKVICAVPKAKALGRRASTSGFWATVSALVFLPLLFVSCGSFDFGDEPPTEVAIDVKNPDFESDIRTLMAVKCMNCHADPAPKRAPSTTPKIDLTVASVFTKYSARVAARVYATPDNPMPPIYGTPFTASELAGLKKFLENSGVKIPKAGGGASGGGSSGGGAGTTVALSAAFGTKCAGCHGAKGEGVIGTPVAKTKKTLAEYKAIVRAGKGTSMPPFAAGAISDADLAADHAALLKL